MRLKDIVDELLKERERSLSWLAQQVGKTFDGFRLSLIKESIKYTDLKKMAATLDVPPSVFFITDIKKYKNMKADLKIEENDLESYPKLPSFNVEVEMYKELTESLKNQLKDKDKIIQLLSKKD